jgi:outer membrane biosynthesis protein TonB
MIHCPLQEYSVAICEGADLSKSAKTPKKKATTKKTTSTKSKPKKKIAKTKTVAKKASAKKKVPPKKKAPAKKAPIKKKIVTEKKKKPPKKKARKAHARKTSSIDNKAMLNELKIEIQSDDEQVSLGSIERLGVLNHPQATQVLIEALSDSRYMVRIHAAAQLGERKDKKSVDALIASLNDDSVFVRQTVAGALENIGGTKAKKAVTQAERDGLLLDELPEGRRLIEK